MRPGERDIRTAIGVVAVTVGLLVLSVQVQLDAEKRLELWMGIVAGVILTPFIIRWRRQSAEEGRRIQAERARRMATPPDPRTRIGWEREENPRPARGGEVLARSGVRKSRRAVPTRR